MSEYWIVERIENNMVVLETKEKIHIDMPLSRFLGGVQEGDVVCLSSDGVFKTDDAATKARKAKLYEMQKKIFQES